MSVSSFDNLEKLNQTKMENCHFFHELMMSMASIALAEAGVHLQDITEDHHMMIELEIIHPSDRMTIVADDQTLCHQGKI